MLEEEPEEDEDGFHEATSPARDGGPAAGAGRGDCALLVNWVEKGVAPAEVRSPLRGGGELTVKPYPRNWNENREETRK